MNKPYGIDTFWQPLCKKIIESGSKLNYLSNFEKSKYPKNIFESIKIVKLFEKIHSQKVKFSFRFIFIFQSII